MNITSTSPILVKAENIEYRFDLEGNIVPYLSIIPQLHVSEDKVITHFPLVGCKPDLTLAHGDTIAITPPHETSPNCTLHIVEKSKEDRTTIHPVVCPICGSELLPSVDGVGRCINRYCRAQVSARTQCLLAALGFVFNDTARKILTLLFARGSLDSPADIFCIDFDSIEAPNISTLEFKTFQLGLHTLRGRVTVGQMLLGLRIPRIDHSASNMVDRALAELGITFKDTNCLLNVDWLKESIPEVDWSGWKEFLSNSRNEHFAKYLCLILYR